MKKVNVEIEERILSNGTWKDHSITRVLRPLGNAGDFYVSFKNTIVPVSKRWNDTWHGVIYG